MQLPLKYARAIICGYYDGPQEEETALNNELTDRCVIEFFARRQHGSDWRLPIHSMLTIISTVVRLRSGAGIKPRADSTQPKGLAERNQILIIIDDYNRNDDMIKSGNLPTHTHSLPELDDLLGYALRRAQIKVFQHLVGQLDQFNLRPAQFSAMALIHQHPGLTQVELARILSIEPPQLVLIANKLEERGLAVRIRSKTDKRSYGLYLSKPGEALLAKLHQIAAASDEAATANLSDPERAQLRTLLQKVYQD